MHSVRNHPGLKIIAISTCLLFILLFSACSIGSVFKTIFRIFGKAEGDHGADAEEYAVMLKVLDAIQSRDENAPKLAYFALGFMLLWIKTLWSKWL